MTTVTLRPNTTIENPGHNRVPASGSIAGHVSDDSDSTRAEWPRPNKPANSDWVQLGMGTVTLPSGAMPKSVRNRGRARHTTVGTAQGDSDLQVVLRVNGATFSAATLDAHVTSASFVTFNGPLVANSTVSSWTQSGVNSFELWFRTLNVPAGGGAFGVVHTQDISELYLDLVYATKPVCNATGPTGSQATFQPTVTWTHTPGSDGAGQSRYQVRVFSAAQYGAGGFNPVTSAATWDSGAVASGATSRQIGVDLVDGTTYRAYVRTAQLTNGVVHWSDFDFSGFSINIVNPSCDVTGPTGEVTTTKQPNATWTYSGASAQTRYQVKVFTQAQYSIGGFSPDTSPNTWNSGEVASAATSVQIGTPLVDGTTYRAYVRVARTVEAVPVWSTWDFEGFSVDTRPLTTVTAPVGVTDDDEPTVTWTYAAITAQTHYQAKVFSEAQFQGGGFDPSTSPNTWDSGEVASAATTVDVGDELDDGRYAVYVRTARTDGAPIWSPWASSIFIVNTGDLVVSAGDITHTERPNTLRS